MLLAAFTKSAQFPFHFWLPNAMQAPTPVSAYLHSATMVKAGVYLVARMTPLLGGTAMWTGTITVVATLTMTIGALRALFETDLKRVLAYSTISALGILMLLFGIGTPQAVAAGFAYLLAHACYKGALFLVAGAVEHETGTRDVASLGGLRRAMPLTAIGAALAAGSMAGIPLFGGFIAKEQFYDSIGDVDASGHLERCPRRRWPSRRACVLAPPGSSPASLRFVVAPCRHPRPTMRRRLSGWDRWCSVCLAWSWAFCRHLPQAQSRSPANQSPDPDRPLTPRPLARLHRHVAVERADSRWFVDLVHMRALDCGGFGGRRALQAERLYTFTLAGLDALSRRVAPALQSASLRSYVAHRRRHGDRAGGDRAGERARAFRRHAAGRRSSSTKRALAALIVAGALSATFARSSMAAALSLGTVGYGVAVMYALLGAPDLAMTQFAVETLTVVIFVLVFYRLRGFGDLSSRLVRSRDALVAVAAGALVTTLVLFVGASGTTSRLAAYFADAAPRLAHGLNVVNVILVDFRGFDTLGEITVLVTVAIGVRALLLIGRERRQ